MHRKCTCKHLGETLQPVLSWRAEDSATAIPSESWFLVKCDF